MRRNRPGAGHKSLGAGSTIRRFIGTCAIVALAVTATACGGSAQGRGGAPTATGLVDSKTAAALKAEGEVNIIDNTYGSQPVQAALLAKVINEFGGDAKVTTMADIPSAWKVMGTTPNAIQPEMWTGLYPDEVKQYITDEKSVVTSRSPTIGAEGWFVPTYVIKGDPSRNIKPTCPGLPDWRALNDCVNAFKTAATGDKGQYMNGMKAWVSYYGDDDRIKNLGLNYEMTFAGSEAALMAEWKRNYEAGKPFLALLWGPTYIALKYDVTKVEFPPHSAECYATTHACDWPDIDIQNTASAKLPDGHPLAWQIVKKYDLGNDQLRTMMLSITDDGMTTQQAVDKWFGENRAIWEKWAPTPASS